MRSRRRSKFVPVLVVSVALAGAAFTAPAGSAATAKLKTPAVKLMLITELSGGVTTTELPDGAKAAVKALNNGDGIGGYKATLTVCDTKNDPNTAAACGQKAVDGKYLAVVGSQSTQAGEVLPPPPGREHPGGRQQRRSTSPTSRNPDSFPLTAGSLSTSWRPRAGARRRGLEEDLGGLHQRAPGSDHPHAGEHGADPVRARGPEQGGDRPGHARSREPGRGGDRRTGPTGSSSRSRARTRSTSSRPTSRRARPGRSSRSITTDAAAVLKVIKGQDLDFYGSAELRQPQQAVPGRHEGGGVQEPGRSTRS